MNYASTFSINNLVNPPNEFRNYYAQLVRRIEEPLKWLMGRLGLKDGGIINLVYLTYNKLSKLIHPVTRIGNKQFLSGVVIDALLDYDMHGMPSSRHLYAPFECDDTDDAWFKELMIDIKLTRLVLYVITYTWAENTGLMKGGEGMEILKRKIEGGELESLMNMQLTH